MKNLHKSKLAQKNNYLILLIFIFMTTLILLSMNTIVIAGFGSSIYDTSITFYNTGSTELTVRGTVYDEDGRIVGTPNSDLVAHLLSEERFYLSGDTIEEVVGGIASSYQGWLELENVSDALSVQSSIRSKAGGPMGNMSTEVEKTVTANGTSVFKVLGIPSIDNYEKGFIRFCNMGTTSTTIRGTLYNEDGSLIGTPESTLIPGLNSKAIVVMDLYQLAKAVNGGPVAGKLWPAGILWLEVQADSKNVSVQLLFGKKPPGNNMIGDFYPYVSNLSAETRKTNQNGISFFNVLNIPTANAIDIGVIHFYNTGNTPATVRGTLYNQKDGHVIGTPDAVLMTSTDFTPHKIITLDIDDLAKIFDGISQTEGRVWLKAQADSKNVSIQLLTLYKGGGLWVDNSSEVKGESGNKLFKLLGVPSPNAQDRASIYIYNTGTIATTVQGTLYNGDGHPLFKNQSLLALDPQKYGYLNSDGLLAQLVGNWPNQPSRGQLWINTDSADVSVQFFLIYKENINNMVDSSLKTNNSSINSTFIPIGFAPPSPSNTPPKIANITKIDNITLTRADFTNAFTDANGDRLTHIRIESLPKDGILKLNDIAVNVGDEIKAEELDNLIFTPNDNWHGATRFAWNGRDFTLYANKKAVTNLVINPLTLNLTNMGMEGSSGTAMASPGMNNGFNCQPETNCAEEYQYGSTVTLTVTPSDNSTFLGWVGGCKDSFTIKKNMNCKAVFDQANKLIDCSDNNITIETISSGDWNSSTTWQRLTGNDLPNEPIKNDIVRINSLHTITSPFYAIKMKALCIKPEATLTSFDDQGTPLEIQASDYFENNGIVVGKAGANENENIPCTNKDAVGTGACAMPGADVIVKVGKSRNQEGNGGWKSYYSGGPILNTGQIMAGKGGDAFYYSAPGGNVTVLGRNTINQGTIQAGQGGNVLGNQMGEGGRGGSTQIRGNLGGYGNLYNQNGAQALAGNGGNCNPDPTAFGERSGEGGDLLLVSIPKVYLNGGIQRTGLDGANCLPRQPNDIWPNGFIEPSIIDLSGANTTVTGGNIAIYGGEDWILDLSNLNGTVVDATGNITLAVGDGGVIDLRGSKGTILKAADQVQIFADEILVDDNVNPSDLIQANNVALDSSKILREVSLIGANKLRWEPEVILPVHLTLANNGPEADTYTLNVTDSASWVLSQLPPTIEVEGLEAIDLVLNVTPPATRGEIDTITVVATSQSDPNITATAHVQIFINPEPMTIPQPFDDSDATPPAIGDDSPSEPSTTTSPDETSPSTSPDETSIPIPAMNGEDENKEEESSIDIITLEGTIVVPIPSTTPQCPSTGEINWLCINNREQILTDVTIEKEGIIAGGMLAGTINNQGLISRVKIQPNTIVSGGKLTGYIQNEGTLANFAFVGAQVSGGILAGIITNDSRVGGIFINVHLAADTHITGGNLQGEITGEAAEPALLEELTVKANSHLAFVTIGKNVQLENQVTFGDGVQFVNADEDPRTVEVIATDSKPTTISQNTEVVTTCHTELPQLGAMATDSQGKTVATRAQLAGGAAATSETFQRELTVSLSTPVDIRATLCVDPNQVGQLAGFIVYVAYTAADSPNRKLALYRLDVNNQVLPWDGNFASLLAFKEDILEPTQTVEIYQGKLVAPPGVIEIHLGYRLEEGSVTVSDKTIQITITN